MSQDDSMPSESELHAYIDHRLDEARMGEIEAMLASRPEEAERVEAYRRQNAQLHALFDPILDEAPPSRLQRPARRLSWPIWRIAATAAWMVMGGVVGWGLHGQERAAPGGLYALPQQAAIAHVVYTPEVRHPVEVAADTRDSEAHLVAWLSKRMGGTIRAPHLSSVGYTLMGGRLLPADDGPAAQFMYGDGQGNRLTLYLRKNAQDNRETAFRYADEGGTKVFYWVDGSFGYALSGSIDKSKLLVVAQAVYRELNP
ncbi:MAG: anti-sigma factor family protein [Burkholderiales bacterium]